EPRAHAEGKDRFALRVRDVQVIERRDDVDRADASVHVGYLRRRLEGVEREHSRPDRDHRRAAAVKGSHTPRLTWRRQTRGRAAPGPPPAPRPAATLPTAPPRPAGGARGGGDPGGPAAGGGSAAEPPPAITHVAAARATEATLTPTAPASPAPQKPRPRARTP